MAQNTRIRIEPDIEEYLKSQAQRVLGKSADSATGADLTTITNRLLYEHKMAQLMARQVPFARLFNWIMGIIPGTGNGKVVQLQHSEQPALKEAQKEAQSRPEDNFDFDADFASQFEFDEDAA
jgi:hypothetical protein